MRNKQVQIGHFLGGAAHPQSISSITTLGKNNEMGVRDFLRRTKNRLHNRSEARSEIENPVGSPAPHPMESPPDLSNLPSTYCSPGFNDIQKVSSQATHLAIGNPSGVGLPTTPHPTESAPDLRAGASALPSTSCGPGSNDVQAVSSQTTHLEIKNPSGIGPSVPRPIESTPDLRIDPSTVSLTPRGPESNGMHAVSSQVIRLTALLCG